MLHLAPVLTEIPETSAEQSGDSSRRNVSFSEPSIQSVSLETHRETDGAGEKGERYHQAEASNREWAELNEGWDHTLLEQ